jgi:hypothetical protein
MSVIPTYPLNLLQSDGNKIDEVFDYEDVYYVIAYNEEKNYTSYWKINKKNKEMTVSSWPGMIIETKGRIDDTSFGMPVEDFIKVITLS